MVKSNIKKELNVDKEKVWNSITDYSSVSWRSDIVKIEVIDETHFVEYTKNNYPAYFTIVSKEKLEEYSFTIKNANMKGKWIGILQNLIMEICY